MQLLSGRLDVSGELGLLSTEIRQSELVVILPCGHVPRCHDREMLGFRLRVLLLCIESVSVGVLLLWSLRKCIIAAVLFLGLFRLVVFCVGLALIRRALSDDQHNNLL